MQQSDLLSEFKFLCEIKKKSQENYDAVDNSEGFQFSMSHISAVLEAYWELDKNRMQAEQNQ